jgi:hypothetical protein
LQRLWGPLFHELKEEFEDTKGVIRNRKSKRTKNIMVNEKGKRTSNDLQNITQITKDRTTGTLPKTGDVLGINLARRALFNLPFVEICLKCIMNWQLHVFKNLQDIHDLSMQFAIGDIV